MPPSAEMISPVTKRDTSAARNTTTSAMSSATAQRPSGVCASMPSTTPGTSLLRAHSAVSTTPGSDRVDADSRAPVFHRQRPRSGVERALRRGVGGAPRRAHLGRHRRQVDDRTAAGCNHRRHERGDEEERRAHVDRVEPIDELRVELRRRQPGRGRGVVDQHVDGAERVERGARRCCRRVRVLEVGGEDDGLVRQAISHLVQRGFVTSRHCDTSPGAVEHDRDGGADTA